MGFYHPATLVKDAQRHGVPVFPIDVTCSTWRCRLEQDGFRLGLRYVKGLREEAGQRIAQESARAPLRDVRDLVQRCDLREDESTTLAQIGALGSLGLSRRAALWQVAKLVRPAGPLFAELPCDDPSPLPEMTAREETAADYQGANLTVGPHVMAYWRDALRARGIVTTTALESMAADASVRTAGCVIVRQRPGTAKGFVFLTLEDEVGMAQAIVEPRLFQRYRAVIVGSSALVVEGTLQRFEGTLSVKARQFWSLDQLVTTPSHDFH
jgi:error-prone DNA polymerase